MSNRFLLVLVVALGCTAGLYLGMRQRPQIPAVPPEHAARQRVAVAPRAASETARQRTTRHRIALYVAEEQNQDFNLVASKHRVAASTPEQALEQLIEFPKQRGDLYGTMPPGTRLRGIDVKADGTAEVDFSREFVDNFPGGSRWEAIVLYSVVDTLTQFPGIKRVRFLVEGRPIGDLGGHVDLTEPLERSLPGAETEG
ncbi:MAG TPA: GerMN domain-containing protein [Armatimonadota bacterium]|jgi:spore germination protein GerM